VCQEKKIFTNTRGPLASRVSLDFVHPREMLYFYSISLRGSPSSICCDATEQHVYLLQVTEAASRALGVVENFAVTRCHSNLHRQIGYFTVTVSQYCTVNEIFYVEKTHIFDLYIVKGE